MADELRLSKQLVDNIMNVVMNEDSRAKDPFIGSQYLTAVVGYVVGTAAISDTEKKEIMDELSSFMHHVFEDVAQPEAVAVPAAPVAPPGSAFGIWKPDNA
ncbi:MAG: hypothetical protein CBC79_02490 [Gammaproteobacteria bacterium TMED119]|nr:MAG: hypothetical protein CBC79_02490 [Gammaproteobacteria bacterium TMED119]RCL44695.1 MAG: hypothetical protein DBW91_05815 [Candidatus Thioglobus sp.]|tara:strand:+ start:2521 stop:2823 length:303 start_codon:yes stop_codon:yes gene_type:complete